MMKKLIGLLLVVLFGKNLFTQSAVNPSRSASFSWWRAIDVEAGLTKEEIFDAYLQDLVAVGKIGYKALPNNLDLSDQKKSVDNTTYYLKQGRIVSTNYSTDFAIKGHGFFKLLDGKGGVFYSRAGNFKRDKDGFLQNEDGWRLEPPIQLESDYLDLFIDDEATLWQSIDKIRDAKNLYQFELWLPSPESKIERVGSHFSFTDALPITTVENRSTIAIKSLELSTTEGVKTLAQMAQILYDLRDQDNYAESLSFRLYMIDFLLKEYSMSQGNLDELQKFSYLTESISSSILFVNNDDK